VDDSQRLIAHSKQLVARARDMVEASQRARTTAQLASARAQRLLGALYCAEKVRVEALRAVDAAI